MAGNVYFCTCSLNSFLGGGDELRGVTPSGLWHLWPAPVSVAVRRPCRGHPRQLCGGSHTLCTPRTCPRLITLCTPRTCPRLITACGLTVLPWASCFREQHWFGGTTCFSSGFMDWWQVGGDRGGLLVLTGHVSVHATSLQSCLTLCCPMDCSPPCSSVHGILQARILKWVAIPFSRDLPNPGIEPTYPTFAGGFFTTSAT